MRQQLRQGLSSGLPSTLYQLESSMTSLTARSSRLVASHKSSGTHAFIQKRSITQQYAQRLQDAKEKWGEQAKEIKAGKKQSFLSMLEERGLVQSIVGDRDTLDKIITNKRIGWYAGVDPTGPSLHIGHMLPFMILGWAYVHGMKSVWLMGGSTGKVGDPTGRFDSRPLMKPAIRKAYIASMHMQLKKLGLSFEKYGGRHGYEWEWAWRRALENNNTWLNKLSFYELVSTLGSHMRLGPMLGRDTVKNRLESGDGMSFSEFTYPLMQAWDYWYLYQRGVQVQVGGSDQYGNILFGIEGVKNMIKHHGGEEFTVKPGEDPDLIKPMGLTTPLLTTASGEKIGKSAGNAVWLDPEMTSSYDLYQYFMRLSDADAERLLKLLTFVPLPKISQIMEEHNRDPSQRIAHHALARDFLEIVHGLPLAKQAEAQHKNLFMANRPAKEGTSKAKTPVDVAAPQIEEQVHDLPFTVPSHNLTLPRSLVVGQFFHKIIHSAGLASSKQEAFRLIVNNGASVGSMASGKEIMGNALSYVPIRTWPAYVTETFIIDNSLLIIRIGKWRVKIIKIVSDEEFKAKKLSVPGWEEKESTEEEAEDRKLMSQRRRIAGRQVKLPAMADPGKPKIVRLYRDGQLNDKVTVGSNAHRPPRR